MRNFILVLLLLLTSFPVFAISIDDFDISYKIRLVGGRSTGFIVISDIAVLEDHGEVSLRVAGEESASSLCKYLGMKVLYVGSDETIFAGDRYAISLQESGTGFDRTLSAKSAEYLDYITCQQQ
jgi:hypothetical protein